MMLGIFPLRPPRGVASFSERLARVQLLRGLRILGIHVHDEVRIWSKERHLAFRIATIGAVRVRLDQFPNRKAIGGFLRRDAGMSAHFRSLMWPG